MQSGRWNVVETGAVADGTTDNTAAFQKALDAAGKAGGGIVEVPAGRFRVDGTLSIPRGRDAPGHLSRAAHRAQQDARSPTAPCCWPTPAAVREEGPPFIRLAGSNAAVAGLVVAYPEWKQSDVPPVPYPPCVASHDTENVGIRDCCFLNPYEAIKLVRAHRHLVRNVTGYPSKRGIFVDECYDIGHIENIHFWPFGVAYNPDEPYCKWVNTRGRGLRVGPHRLALRLQHVLLRIRRGLQVLRVEGGQHQRQLPRAGSRFLPPGGAGRAGPAAGTAHHQRRVRRPLEQHGFGLPRDRPEVEGKVSLVNCSFWGPIDRCVWMRSPVGQFTASACHFVHWDNHAQVRRRSNSTPARRSSQGCTFVQDGKHVQVRGQVRSAAPHGEPGDGRFRVRERAGPRVQAFANEVDPLDVVPGAAGHYRLDVGAVGDDGYLRRWHGRENRGTADAPRPRAGRSRSRNWCCPC